LGGSDIYIDDLAEEYNRMHFPRNINFRELDPNTVKKTLQGDLSKLLRDRLITRTRKYPQEKKIIKYNKPYRKYAYYSLTEEGKKYVNFITEIPIIK
jgi:hypothetical protein